MTVTVRRARDRDEVDAALALRVRVFCEEQGVPRELELDGLDDESLQVVALDESGIIATCRLREVEDDWKLERMAVDARVRGLGVGGRLLADAEEVAQAEGAEEMLLYAQVRAEPFYSANGYVREGEEFMEAGIEHIAMRKRL